ncbi:MAG: Ig-like domain-containing protein, partial [Bacteroidales bacterium]
MRNYYKKYLLYLTVLFLGACANIVTPSGGAKDILPPVPLKAFPPSWSIDFKENSIKIDFNEYIKITDAASQVVVSPFMKIAPELKLRGKSVVVDFTDTLKPNTTYTVSFGNAISDITENNTLSNYRYVFSTGNIIDSLMLKGSVKNAFTLKPESGLLVMLY